MIHLFGVSKCIVFDTTICPKANIGEGFQFLIFRNIWRETISAAAGLHVKKEMESLMIAWQTTAAVLRAILVNCHSRFPARTAWKLFLPCDGAPKRIRTSDPWFRKPILYPSELWARCDMQGEIRREV